MIPVCAIFLLILLLAPIAVVLQRGGFSRSYSPGADEMTKPDFLAAPGQMVRTSDPELGNNASGEAVYRPPVISSLQSDKPVVAAHIREYDYHEEIPSWAHLSDYVPTGSHHVVHHIVHHVGGTVYSTSGMYDCSMGLHNWRLGWSDDKKVWCCHHDSTHFCEEAPELRYDCDAGKNHWKVSWSHSKRTWCCLHDNPEYCAAKAYDCSKHHEHWSDFEKKWCDWHNDKHYDVHPFYHGIDHYGYPMHHRTYTYHYGSSHHPSWWYGLGHDQPVHPYYTHHVVYAKDGDVPVDGGDSAVPDDGTVPDGVFPEDGEVPEAPVEGEVPEETPAEVLPEETEGETVPEETPEEGLPEETVEGEAVPEEATPEQTVEGEAVPEEATPEETVEGEAVPEEGVTDASIEETPEGGLPEETAAGEAVPDEAAPVEEASDAGPADTVEEK